MPAKSAIRPRKPPTQDRARETVESILEAAAQVLASRGYEGTNTNLIAAKAGVSIGSLYQYFPNKESVIGSLVEKLYDDDRALIEAGLLAMRNESFETLCKTIIDSLIEAFLKRTELRKVIFYEIPRTQRLPQINDMRRYLGDILELNLREREECKDVKNLRLRLFILVNSIEASLYAAVFEYGRNLDRRAFSAELTEMVLNYCVNPDSRSLT